VGAGARRLAFQSPMWDQLFNSSNMIELTKVFRQDEREFVNLLEEVRFGSFSKHGLGLIKSLMRPLKISQGIIPTMLYSTNVDVDTVNCQHLAELPGEELTFKAIDFPPQPPIDLDKLFIAPKHLTLKVGAQVMLLKNLEAKLVNGSRGIVERFDTVHEKKGNDLVERKYPFVRFLNGEGRKITMAEWTTAPGINGSFKRVQFPLKLAWAGQDLFLLFSSLSLISFVSPPSFFSFPFLSFSIY